MEPFLASVDKARGGTPKGAAEHAASAVRDCPTGEETSFKASSKGLRESTPEIAVLPAEVYNADQASPSGRSWAASMHASLQVHAATLTASLPLRQAPVRQDADRGGGEQQAFTQPRLPSSVEQGLLSFPTDPLSRGCVAAKEEEEESEEERGRVSSGPSSCIKHITLHMSEVSLGVASILGNPQMHHGRLLQDPVCVCVAPHATTPSMCRAACHHAQYGNVWCSCSICLRAPPSKQSPLPQTVLLLRSGPRNQALPFPQRPPPPLQDLFAGYNGRQTFPPNTLCRICLRAPPGATPGMLASCWPST